MDKSDFINSLICEEKIEEILKIPHYKNRVDVIRVIKDHDASNPLLVSDFYPSIMERSGGVMPTFDKQRQKTKIDNFGTSFYLDNNNSREVILSVPTLREEMKALSFGTITNKHGLISFPDNTGHLVLYLFDPLNNNLPKVFKYVEE